MFSHIVLHFRENVLVTIGNAELSNNMALYTADQDVFIETFYSSAGSCVAVERPYRRELSVRVVPSLDIINRIVN
jgi:hypothetical protein